jgi:hypothetical protein
LAAALMHASWNLLVKLKLDRFLSLFLLQSLMGLMGLAMLFFFCMAFARKPPLCPGLRNPAYGL